MAPAAERAPVLNIGVLVAWTGRATRAIRRWKRAVARTAPGGSRGLVRRAAGLGAAAGAAARRSAPRQCAGRRTRAVAGDRSKGHLRRARVRAGTAVYESIALAAPAARSARRYAAS